MTKAPRNDIKLLPDTELLLLRLALKTELLLQEAEALVLAIANRQAQEAAFLDRQDAMI